MVCPKCGTVQADGRQECSKCGIFFARWRPRTQTTTPLPPEPDVNRVPVSIVAVIAVVLILLGFAWTKHHRDARTAAPTMDNMLDSINNQQLSKARERQARLTAEAERRAQATSPRLDPSQPIIAPGLDAGMARGIIEQCSYFNQRIVVALPKSFSASLWQWNTEHYPALAAAISYHLVEVDRGSTVTVKLTAPAVLIAPETADEYHLDLGRRRVETVTASEVRDTYVNVTITWSFENPEGASLAPERGERAGTAELVRLGNAWSLRRVSRINRGELVTVCP